MTNLSDISKQASDQSTIIQSTEFSKVLESVESSAAYLKKSFSGSWLGYQSRVYYTGFTQPPPGAHFSSEWGIEQRYSGLGSTGDWAEFVYDDVTDHIFKSAGNPDINPSRAVADIAIQNFERLKSAAVSLIYQSVRADPQDELLAEILAEIKTVHIPTYNDLISMAKPGQVMTRDSIAAGQRIQTPPHIAIQAQISAIRQPFLACESLAVLTQRASNHLNGSRNTMVATLSKKDKVFIGHGRSQVWRDLKDFLSERLKLSYDEFNRVPVAGLTNITRLEQMLDESSIAFLVMTAEDEQAEGKMHARMNVIHEAGLFQGRLGFNKAILLIEDGCEEFSNVQGLGQIRFPAGDIASKFEDIRRVLEREKVI